MQESAGIQNHWFYSTGNSAQCYVAAWMGGESGGEWIHVYVWLSRFAVRLKLSQHCSSAIRQYKIKSFKRITGFRPSALLDLSEDYRAYSDRVDLQAWSPGRQHQHRFVMKANSWVPPGPTKSETAGVRLRDLCFHKSSREFWCKHSSENHWCRDESHGVRQTRVDSVPRELCAFGPVALFISLSLRFLCSSWE